jgi:hypothetical protein
VAAVFRRSQQMPVGEPGKLGRQLVALAQGGRDGHGEAILEQARAHPLKPADMIDIGDHALADLGGYGRNQRHAAGRHIHYLAGIFLPVGEHVAPQQIDVDALKPSPFLAMWQDAGGALGQIGMQ